MDGRHSGPSPGAVEQSADGVCDPRPERGALVPVGAKLQERRALDRLQAGGEVLLGRDTVRLHAEGRRDCDEVRGVRGSEEALECCGIGMDHI